MDDMKKYIFFDLDGTLTASGPGIINAVNYVLKEFGIDVKDKNELISFIGPPLEESFIKFYHFDELKAKEASIKFREYYLKTGIYESSLYEGVDAMLKTLKEHGLKLMIATAKQEEQAIHVLQYFNIDKYFTFVGGCEPDKRITKGDVIRYVLKENEISNLDEVLMVGDRENDISGAKENGIECLSVLYGYGSEEEFKEAGTDYIVETVSDVVDKIIKWK